MDVVVSNFVKLHETSGRAMYAMENGTRRMLNSNGRETFAAAAGKRR